MAMFGCLACGPSERGAFGFSKEKSFVYCTIALSVGAVLFSAPPPFPLGIFVSLSACPPVAWIRLANKPSSVAVRFINPPPVLRRKIDDLGILGTRLGPSFVRPSQSRRQKCKPDEVGEKAWKNEENAAKRGAEAALQSLGCEPPAIAENRRDFVARSVPEPAQKG